MAKNGLIHYVLKAPHTYFFRDAYPLMTTQTHVVAAAHSDESMVEMPISDLTVSPWSMFN